MALSEFTKDVSRTYNFEVMNTMQHCDAAIAEINLEMPIMGVHKTDKYDLFGYLKRNKYEVLIFLRNHKHKTTTIKEFIKVN